MRLNTFDINVCRLKEQKFNKKLFSIYHIYSLYCKPLDVDVHDEDKEGIIPDNEVIIDGTNWEIDDEEKESWYYKS